MLFSPSVLFVRFAVSKQRRFQPNRIVSLLFVAAIVITFVALLPSYQSGGFIAEKAINAVGFFSLALYSGIAASLASLTFGRHSSIKVLLNSAYVACVAVCGAQLLLLGAGLESPLAESAPQVGTEAITLSLIGLDFDRIILPLASGFQAGAIAPLVASIIALTRIRKGAGLQDYVFFFVGLLPLLFLDARQFLLAIIVTVALTTKFVPAWVAATGAALLPAIFVALPTIVREILPFLTGIATMRSDKFGMFSGREYIWNQYWRYVADIDAAPLLFGHGIYGHAISGVSARYGRLFGGWGEEAQGFMHLHNSYLQILMDSGLLGLAIWGAMIWAAIYRTLKNSEGGAGDAEGWRSIGQIIIALCVVASSEVVFGVYMKEAICITLAMFAAVAVYNRQRDSSLSRSRHRQPAHAPAWAESRT